MIIFAIGLLAMGLFNHNDTLVLTSGLFAIASSIDTLRYQIGKKDREK